EHENLLEHEAFWDDVQYAVASLAGVAYTPAVPPAAAETTPSYAGDYDDYQPPPGTGELPQEDGNPNTQSTGIEEFAPAESAQQPPSDVPQGEADADSDATEPAAAVATAPVPEDWYSRLQTAGSRLLSAREVLYPVTIHLLDLSILEESKL